MNRLIRRTAGLSLITGVAALFIAFAASGCSETTDPNAGKQQIAVSLTEYSIVLTPNTLHPGTAVFTVKNNGSEDHNFEVENEDNENEKSFEKALKPGETGTLEVVLIAGHYAFYDPSGTNKEKGMDTDIDVK